MRTNTAGASVLWIIANGRESSTSILVGRTNARMGAPGIGFLSFADPWASEARSRAPSAHSFKGVVIGDAASRRLAGGHRLADDSRHSRRPAWDIVRVFRLVLLSSQNFHSLAYLVPICIEGGLKCCLQFCTPLET